MIKNLQLVPLQSSACNIVTASLPELLQSSNKNNNNNRVWYKLPDIPYSSLSINHYQGFSEAGKLYNTGETVDMSFH